MDSLWWSVSNNLKASHECCHCLGSASTLFRKKILTSYSLLCTHLLYSFSLPCPLVYFVQGFFLFIVSTILQKRKNTLYFFFYLPLIIILLGTHSGLKDPNSQRNSSLESCIIYALFKGLTGVIYSLSHWRTVIYFRLLSTISNAELYNNLASISRE